MCKEVFDLIRKEEERQRNVVELIASENYVSRNILKAVGSVLTNKYSEGYPNKRYYGGCEVVDEIEQFAIDNACKLFNCKYANVQPHSGSQANMAAYMTLVELGDTILAMDLSHGGHLTHGSGANFSGKLYNFVSYGVNENGYIDYDVVGKLALEHKPKLIVAGASAYARKIDFKRFKEIADKVGAYFMVDIAHIAGLVVTGYHESPLPYADIVTTTTHKTLRGPRGGMILTNNDELIKKINNRIFPGIQGGPLQHVIAGKAICFKEAQTEEFKTYIKNVVENTQYFAEELKNHGFKLVSDGTDNHLILIDLTNRNITGKEAQEILDSVNISTNKNTIPNETRSPFVTSGLRIGTAAITTRGFGKDEIKLIVEIMDLILRREVIDENNELFLSIVKEHVQNIFSKYPVPNL